jgi:dTMP kinase
LDELTKIRAAALDQSRDDKKILVRIGMATCGITAGARQTLTRLLDLMAQDRIPHIQIVQTSCMGDCDKEPILEVVDLNGKITRYEQVGIQEVERLYYDVLRTPGTKPKSKKTKTVSLEGGEGSGKTTLLAMLQDYFTETGLDVMITREPGGVRIAEKIREIILDIEHTEMDVRTEALLYAAARRQHLTQKVLPELGRRDLVLFDRFVDSSVVYQGYVRGIGMDEVYELNRFATEDFLPDMTLYLDIDPAEGLKRVYGDSGREINRLDLEAAEFHVKVREGYRIMLSEHSERMIEIDASRPVEAVFEDVKNLLDNLMKQD